MVVRKDVPGLSETKHATALEHLVRPETQGYESARSEGVVHTLCAMAVGYLEAWGAAVSVPRGRTLTLLGATGEDVARLERTQHFHAAGAVMEAISSGETIAVDKISERSEAWPAYAALADQLDIIAVLALPLGGPRSPAGVLTVYRREPLSWTEQDLDRSRHLAELARVLLRGIERERLPHDIEGVRRRVEATAVIEQARGMIAANRKVTVDEALGILQRNAREGRMPLVVIADAVVRHGLPVQ